MHPIDQGGCPVPRSVKRLTCSARQKGTTFTSRSTRGGDQTQVKVPPRPRLLRGRCACGGHGRSDAQLCEASPRALKMVGIFKQFQVRPRWTVIDRKRIRGRARPRLGGGSVGRSGPLRAGSRSSSHLAQLGTVSRWSLEVEHRHLKRWPWKRNHKPRRALTSFATNANTPTSPAPMMIHSILMS